MKPKRGPVCSVVAARDLGAHDSPQLSHSMRTGSNDLKLMVRKRRCQTSSSKPPSWFSSNCRRRPSVPDREARKESNELSQLVQVAGSGGGDELNHDAGFKCEKKPTNEVRPPTRSMIEFGVDLSFLKKISPSVVGLGRGRRTGRRERPNHREKKDDCRLHCSNAVPENVDQRPNIVRLSLYTTCLLVRLLDLCCLPQFWLRLQNGFHLLPPTFFSLQRAIICSTQSLDCVLGRY